MRITFMMQMAQQLNEKKRLEVLMKTRAEKKEEAKKKIDVLNKKAIAKLKEIEDYALINKQKGVVMFA